MGDAQQLGMLERLCASPGMARAWLESAALINITDVLPTITVPTLVVHGDTDVRAPVSVAEDLHAGISGSRLVVLQGAGHVCSLEAPDALNVAIRDFLRVSR